MSGGRDLGFAFALLWIRLTVLARAAHAHGGVLLSTGPQPLTQNRGKSEKQNFPITPGKEEKGRGEEEEEGRAQQKRQFRAWADGDAENGSAAATLELSALPSPPAPIAISRARSPPNERPPPPSPSFHRRTRSFMQTFR